MENPTEQSTKPTGSLDVPLPLDPFETPASQRSNESYFDSVFSETHTPLDEGGRPWTPLSSIASTPSSPCPARDNSWNSEAEIPRLNIESDEDERPTSPEDSDRGVTRTTERHSAAIELARASSPTTVSTSIVNSTSETVSETVRNYADKEVSEEGSTPRQKEHSPPDVELPASSARSTTLQTHEKRQTHKLDIFGIPLFKILPSPIKDRYHQNSDQCCASLVRNKNKRCRKHASSRVGDFDFDSQLDSLSRPESLLDIPKTLKSAQSIISSTFCSRHKQIAKGLLPKLTTEMGKLCDSWPHNLEELEAARDTLDHNLYIFDLWIKTLAGTVVDIGEEHITSIQQSRPKKEDSDRECDAATSSESTVARAIIRRRYTITFEPYHTEESERYDAKGYVIVKMLPPLSPQELKSGTIYMYRLPGINGHVKIGLTKRTTKKREGEWRDKCKQDVEHCQSFEGVPHVHRVERLIHAELKEAWKTINDCKCGVSHREWFEVPEEDAIALIEKWVAWIRTDPYHEVAARNRMRWELRDEARRRAFE